MFDKRTYRMKYTIDLKLPTVDPDDDEDMEIMCMKASDDGKLIAISSGVN